MNSSSLNNAQKDKIAQFTGVTGSNGSAAIECLQAKNWSLERAIDHFYVTGMSTHPSYMVGTGGGGSNHKRGGGRNSNSNDRIDRGAIKQLYTKYADPNNDKILAEGIIQFCSDIGITPDDVVMLVLAERMGADVMGEISKEQFETGLAGLMLDSLEKIKAALPSLRAQIVGYNNDNNNNNTIGLGGDAESRRRFKEIYNFAYLISRENGQKCVQLDMALEMWSLLLPPQRWPLIHHWCAFLKETHNRTISRDTWVQLVEFIENVPQDGEYTGYDDSGAWPYLVDEFVAWYREKHGGDDGGVEHMLE